MSDQLTCQDVANYFLYFAKEPLTNFKLQKLVYYAQGFHPALFSAPLFGERIEARQHGPVITALYNQYQVYESNPIARPENLDFSRYSEDVKNLLESIIVQYGKFSTGKLRDLVQAEMPWINGFKSETKFISDIDLRQYFMTQIKDRQIKSSVLFST